MLTYTLHVVVVVGSAVMAPVCASIALDATQTHERFAYGLMTIAFLAVVVISAID